MRTTILIGSLLFLAGYGLAQDSPITVGDSSSQPPLPGKKAGTRGASTSLQHAHFNGNGDNYHVKDHGNKAACFEVVNLPRNPRVLLGQQWTIVLNDGVVLTTTDGNRIDVVYNGKKVTPGGTPSVDEVHTVVGDSLTSEWLINGGQATEYSVSTTPFQKPFRFKIHYCTPKAGGSLDCTDASGKDACQ